MEEVREIHQRIWDYAIKYGEKPYTPYEYDCVLCEYAVVHPDLWACDPYVDCLSKCTICPVIWTGSDCVNIGSEYREWKFSSGEEKKHWAKKIRDIPFKEVE